MTQVSSARSIKKNAFMNAVLTASGLLFPLITFPYVSRVIEPGGTGKVSFAASVVSYFIMFSELGIPIYGIRECARLRDDRQALSKTVQELFFINLIMCMFSCMAFIISLFLVPKFAQDKPLFLIAGTALILNCMGMEWMYKGLEEYSYITVRSLIFKVIALILMFVTVKTVKDYRMYSVVTVLSGYGSFVLNFMRIRKYIDPVSLKDMDLKRHMKPVLTFFAMSVATTVYLSLDTVMLGFMKGDDEVGYYNAAVRIKSVLTAMVTSLGAVVFPRSAYYIENGKKEEFAGLTHKAMNLVCLVSLPLVVYFCIFANEGIRLLSGTLYGASVVPMQIIMPTVFFIGMTNIIGVQMLLSLGREKDVLSAEIAGAVVDVVINILLIPRFGAAGAAAGTLAAEIMVWIVMIIRVAALREDIYKHIYKNVKITVIALALLISSAASMWLKFTGLGFFWVLLISSVIFFGVYGAVLVIGKEMTIISIWADIRRKLSGDR